MVKIMFKQRGANNGVNHPCGPRQTPIAYSLLKLKLREVMETEGIKANDRSVGVRARKSDQPGQLLLFARNFFKHPRMLGTPIPSSRPLIQEVLNRVNWRETRMIVEYGPGVGNITAEILRRMHPQATLLGIETNPEFIPYLRGSLVDSRLHVAHGSAAAVDGLLAQYKCPAADCIISGIPFSTMPKAAGDEILWATRSVLQPRGAFVVYQYSRQIFPSLKKVFGQVSRNFMLLRMIPIWLFHCQR